MTTHAGTMSRARKQTARTSHFASTIRPLESSLLMSKSTPPTSRPSNRDSRRRRAHQEQSHGKRDAVDPERPVADRPPQSASRPKIAPKGNRSSQRSAPNATGAPDGQRRSRRGPAADRSSPTSSWSSPTATRAHSSIQKTAQSMGVTTREGVTTSTVIVPAQSNGLSSAEPSFLAQSIGAA